MTLTAAANRTCPMVRIRNPTFKSVLTCCTECRNNLGPSYRPREADIWSLGIVLLNLLFHRCPWAEPSLEDADFAEYYYNPVNFLNNRFEGIGLEVSRYLSSHVLNCEGPRVSAREFGKWATQLVSLMSGNDRATLVSEAALPLVVSRPSDMRLSQIISQASSARPSPRSSVIMSSTGTLSITASPSKMPIDLPEDLQQTLQQQLSDNNTLQSADQLANQLPILQIDDSPKATLGKPAQQSGDHHADAIEELDDAVLPSSDPTLDDEAAALAAKAKRRKRGARRGRSTHRPSGHHDAEMNVQPATTATNEPYVDDRTVLLARASQSLARELSKSQGYSKSTDDADRPPLRNSKTSTGFVGRFLKNGNADLEAFAQRAKARDAAFGGGTYSAPAKMQHSSAVSVGSAVSSVGSVGASSWSGAEDEGRSHWASTSSRRERLGRSSKTHYEASQTTNSSPSRMSSVSSSNSTNEYSPSSASSVPSYRPPRYNSSKVDRRSDASPEAGAKPISIALVPIAERLPGLSESPAASIRSQSASETSPAPVAIKLPERPPQPSPEKTGGKFSRLLKTFKA